MGRFLGHHSRSLWPRTTTGPSTHEGADHPTHLRQAGAIATPLGKEYQACPQSHGGWDKSWDTGPSPARLLDPRHSSPSGCPTWGHGGHQHPCHRPGQGAGSVPSPTPCVPARALFTPQPTPNGWSFPLRSGVPPGCPGRPRVAGTWGPGILLSAAGSWLSPRPGFG